MNLTREKFKISLSEKHNSFSFSFLQVLSYEYCKKNFKNTYTCERLLLFFWVVVKKSDKDLKSNHLKCIWMVLPHHRSRKYWNLSPFLPSVAFHKTPVIWFEVLIKWLVSIWNATLGWNELTLPASIPDKEKKLT